MDQDKIKFGSVCSGIEAASVAWDNLGWEAQWYSEIEQFPSAVLAHRFPTVPNLGDMTKIHENQLFQDATIDLLVGGTPCQSFSVAGLRKGLADPRGNLMLTFLSLAERKKPRWIVWENVPGVLSSNGGRDFGTFLQGLAELGYGFAYRVLDARHFGVAQRRRRVFVVGYLGDWRPPAAVLFESYCLQGHPKPSRTERQETPRGTQDSLGESGQGFRMTAFGQYSDDDSASTVKQRDYKDATDLVVEPKTIGAFGKECSDTVTAKFAKGAELLQQGAQNGGNCVLTNSSPKPHAFKVRGGVEFGTGEQGGTPGKQAGKGYLGQDECAYTIGTTQDQQIATPIYSVRDDITPKIYEEQSDTIRARDYKGAQVVSQPIPFRKSKRAQSKEDDETWVEDEQTNTLNTFDLTGDVRATNVVVEPIAIQGNLIGRTEGGPQGIGVSEEGQMYTLTKADVHGVAHHPQPVISPTITTSKGSRGGCSDEALSEIKAVFEAQQPIAFQSVDHGADATKNLSPTLRAHDPMAVATPIAVDTYNYTTNEHTTQTIRSNHTTEHIGAVLEPMAVDLYNQTINAETHHTLRSNASHNEYGAAITPPMVIRRLTPIECELLQGFPRNWTKIPYRNKPEDQCPDGPRYKACGNSMAVPVMRWIGERIQMVEGLLKDLK